MKNDYRAVYPKSYKHLLQLVQAYKLVDRRCECKKKLHLGIFGKFLLVVCVLSFVGSLVLAAAQLFVFGHDSLLNTYLIIFSTVGFALAYNISSLLKRGWIKAHPDKVITDLIPLYLMLQINFMRAALFGYRSRFELIQREVLKVIIKGQETEPFVKRFGPFAFQLPYLIKLAKEGEYCLRFEEVRNLLMKSDKLLKDYLNAKQEEVLVFQESLSASVRQHQKNYEFAQTVCLAQTRALCENLNGLSEKFNYYLDVSHVSEFGSAENLSKDAESSARICKEQANDLLEWFSNYLGVKPEESKAVVAAKEEPSKLEDKKPETPVTESGVLTEADLKELEELDLSSLDK